MHKFKNPSPVDMLLNSAVLLQVRLSLQISIKSMTFQFYDIGNGNIKQTFRLSVRKLAKQTFISY